MVGWVVSFSCRGLLLVVTLLPTWSHVPIVSKGLILLLAVDGKLLVSWSEEAVETPRQNQFHNFIWMINSISEVMVLSFSNGVLCITGAEQSDSRILASVLLRACVVVKQGKVGATPQCCRVETVRVQVWDQWREKIFKMCSEGLFGNLGLGLILVQMKLLPSALINSGFFLLLSNGSS